MWILFDIGDDNAVPSPVSSNNVDYVLDQSLSIEDTLELQLGGEAITLLGFEPMFQRPLPADLGAMPGEIMYVFLIPLKAFF